MAVQELILFDAQSILSLLWQQQSRFPELHKLWHELTLDTAPWDHYGTIVTLSLPPTQLLFIPQALKQLRNFEELHLTCERYGFSSHVHESCC